MTTHSCTLKRNAFFPIAAGTNTHIEYSVNKMARKQGRGSEESRHCKDDTLSRSSCVEETILNRASISCNCSEVQYFTDSSDGQVISGAEACSSNAYTLQNKCIDIVFREARSLGISLDECPALCQGTWGSVTTIFQTKLLEYQIDYMQEIKASVRPRGDLQALKKIWMNLSWQVRVLSFILALTIIDVLIERAVFRRFALSRIVFSDQPLLSVILEAIVTYQEEAKTSIVALLG
jgi:hypothetical protein